MVSFSSHISLSNEALEIWKELGNPSLSMLIKEKLLEEKAKRERIKNAEEFRNRRATTLNDGVIEELAAEEREEEEKLQEMRVAERDYLDNKELRLQQARELFEKNGKKNAYLCANAVTKWKPGRIEIMSILMSEAGVCQK